MDVFFKVGTSPPWALTDRHCGHFGESWVFFHLSCWLSWMPVSELWPNVPGRNSYSSKLRGLKTAKRLKKRVTESKDRGNTKRLNIEMRISRFGHNKTMKNLLHTDALDGEKPKAQNQESSKRFLVAENSIRFAWTRWEGYIHMTGTSTNRLEIAILAFSVRQNVIIIQGRIIQTAKICHQVSPLDETEDPGPNSKYGMCCETFGCFTLKVLEGLH